MRSLTSGADNFLPGFEKLIATRDAIAHMTDEQIDFHFPARTGENLLSTNPRLYHLAAQLFYEFSFSQREIAVMCQISRATVAAIVERETGSTAARTQQTARLNRIKALRERTFANLEGLMADAEAVKKAGPVAIANIWKILGDEEGILAEKLKAEATVEAVETKPNEEDLKYLEGIS